MFTVSGIVFIYTDPVEKRYGNGCYFNFQGVTKDPEVDGPKGRHFYKIALYVPDEGVPLARQQIVKEKMLWIIRGRLSGIRGEKGIFNEIKLSWRECKSLSYTVEK